MARSIPPNKPRTGALDPGESLAAAFIGPEGETTPAGTAASDVGALLCHPAAYAGGRRGMSRGRWCRPVLRVLFGHALNVFLIGLCPRFALATTGNRQRTDQCEVDSTHGTLRKIIGVRPQLPG